MPQAMVAEGSYYSTACHACVISERAFYKWMDEAEIDLSNGLDEVSSLPVRLMQAIKKAESEAETDRVVRIRAAGQKGNWLADMTHLERRYPEKWGRKDRIPQAGNFYNINIEQALIEASHKLDEALERIAERQKEEIPSLEGEDWGVRQLSNHEDT